MPSRSSTLMKAAITVLLLTLARCAVAADPAFVHPGLLSTQADFDRMKLEVGRGSIAVDRRLEIARSNPHDSLELEAESGNGGCARRHDRPAC